MARILWGVIVKHDGEETRVCAHDTKKRAEEEIAWYEKHPCNPPCTYEVRKIVLHR